MVNGIGNTSRNRRQRPLSDDLPEPTRVLLQELRALKERAGLDLRALEQATHASRSSWGRWLSGETWIPLDAVEGLARICGEDERRLGRLWEAAERDRRAAGVPESEGRMREADGKGTGAFVSAPGAPGAPGALGGESVSGHGSGHGPEHGSGHGFEHGPGHDATVLDHEGGMRDPSATMVEGGRAVPEPGVTASGYGTPVPAPGTGVPVPGTNVPVRGTNGWDLDATEPGRDMAVSRPPASRLRRRFLVGTAVGLFLGVAAGVAIGGSVLMNGEGEEPEPTGAVVDRAGTATGVRAKAIDRAAVIERAESWHPGTARRIPYSQTGSHDGYRTDGSGYASMALGLRKPGPNTISLASPALSRRIRMSELLRGDLVIDPVGGNTARAVVIFDRWADSGRTSYWAYQQRAQYGTDHRVVRHGLEPGDDFRAYRPVNIRDGAPGPNTAAPE